MNKASEITAFILTHGRPDRVDTFKSLRKQGFTGRVVIVLDDQDETRAAYEKKFGADSVMVFDKRATTKRVQACDNYDKPLGVMCARRACRDIAESMGIEYFIQLDDDYTQWLHKRNATGAYEERQAANLDAVFAALLEFYKKTNAVTLAIAQTGDYIGGSENQMATTPISRKAMNFFICSTRRPFDFLGRLNEDVNAYVSGGSRGELYLSFMEFALRQRATQINAGGMSEIYLQLGTYMKSFYTVLLHPSSVKISVLNTTNSRIHHKIEWRNTVPCLIRADWKK